MICVQFEANDFHVLRSMVIKADGYVIDDFSDFDCDNGDLTIVINNDNDDSD